MRLGSGGGGGGGGEMEEAGSHIRLHRSSHTAQPPAPPAAPSSSIPEGHACACACACAPCRSWAPCRSGPPACLSTPTSPPGPSPPSPATRQRLRRPPSRRSWRASWSSPSGALRHAVLRCAAPCCTDGTVVRRVYRSVNSLLASVSPLPDRGPPLTAPC